MSNEKKDAGDFTSCPNWGKGGRYVIDITNGQRVPVVEEAPEQAVIETPVPAAAPTEKSKSVKENKRA